MARYGRPRGKAGYWIGGLAAVGVAGGAIVLLRRRSAAPTPVGTTQLPKGAPPNTPQQTTQTGVTTQGPQQPNPLVTTAAPGGSSAPSVSGLKELSSSNGTATITWTGTPVSVYEGDPSYGYDLYEWTGIGWSLLAPEVEPPLQIVGLPSGTRVGIAPVYLAPGGKLVRGAVQGITL